jgi:hypothetical protein
MRHLCGGIEMTLRHATAGAAAIDSCCFIRALGMIIIKQG